MFACFLSSSICPLFHYLVKNIFVKLLIKHCPQTPHFLPHNPILVDSSGSFVKRVGLQPLASWDYRFRIPPEA